MQATDGIYLVKLEVTNTGGIAASSPIWVVFNNGLVDCLDCVTLNYVGAWIALDRPAADLDFDRHVTQSNLDTFTACATGPAIPWTDPCCQMADIDRDGDIDMTDFGLLQRCWTGTGITGDPACAN